MVAGGHISTKSADNRAQEVATPAGGHRFLDRCWLGRRYGPIEARFDLDAPVVKRIRASPLGPESRSEPGFVLDRP